jgi:hypothetical protein
MAKWKRLVERLSFRSRLQPDLPGSSGATAKAAASQTAARSAPPEVAAAAGPFRGNGSRVNPRLAVVGPPAKVNKHLYNADSANNKRYRGVSFPPPPLWIASQLQFSKTFVTPCLDQLEDGNSIGQLWIRSRTENEYLHICKFNNQ